MKCIAAIVVSFAMLSVNSCKKINKITTVIIDFDKTIFASKNSVVFEILGQGKSKWTPDENIDKIREEIELRKRNGSKYPLLDVINSLQFSLEITVDKEVVNKASAIIKNQLTAEFDDIIKMLIKKKTKVIVIGGGYISCDAMVNVLFPLGLIKRNIFSGKTAYDKNGALIISDKERGYANCATGKLVMPINWNKSNVIANLKQQGQIKGQIIVIGDGQNDLEAWKAGQADYFIGFGVNEIDETVKKEAPIYVENMKDLKKEIFNLIN